MAKKNYECDGCGRLFQVDEKEKEPRCPQCRSKALIEKQEKSAGLWSCAPRRGYS
jgi:DNA-directed RNA polymerase subunit RPC12/RpoP